MRSVEQLVSQQVAFYEARRRMENESRQGQPRVGGAAYFGPYLLISRERGSGGLTVARMVGERLGWRVFDREIVEEIARRAQVRRQLVESLDEHSRSLATELFAPMVDHSDLGKDAYFHHLREVVLALGQQGHVVIVGRGARCILPAEFGLSARLIAPLEFRAQRIADAGAITLAEARNQAQKIDAERDAFLHHHFGKSATHLLNYDLVLNAGFLNSAAISEILLTALGQKLGVAPMPQGRL